MKNTNITIKKKYQVKELIKYCLQTGYASVDFETNARHYTHPLFEVTMVGISFQPGISYTIPLQHIESPFRKGGKWKKLFDLIGKQIIENADVVKVAWNLKFEYNVCRALGFTMKGRLFDAMLAKYLLKEERPNDLKSNVALFIPKYAGYDLKGQPGKDASEEDKVNFWSNVPIKELSKYNGLDCDLTLRLMMFFERRLLDNNFYKLFRNMMMMATRVLADSEWHGIPVNEPYLQGLVTSYAEKIENILKDLKNFPIMAKFEGALIKGRIKKAIFKIEDEIAKLEEEEADLQKQHRKGKGDIKDIEKKLRSKQKSIANRRDKIDRHLSRDFTTKKELQLLEPVNFASPAQMIELFFTSKWGFRFKVVRYTVDKKTKKETDRPSTDESVLEELKPKDTSGFIEKLLEYRGVTKLYSTYVLGMQNKLTPDGRIHGSFLLHGTVTGRLSSANPNLQNIPRDTTASDIKKMFIPPKGKILLQLDYSQAELRVLAAQANETEMLRWFREGRDIHLAVACDKNKWDYEWALPIYLKEDKSDPNYTKIKTERKYAKTINFGIVYGQTAKKLALGMESTIEQAEKYLAEYKKRFPNIWKFIQKQQKYAKKHGYVYNLFGRKRRLDNIWSDDWGKMAEAQRQSVNAPIQGAASDYTLFSSILIWEKIQNGELPRDMVQAYTVHDSLGFFLDPADLIWVVPILEKICSDPETMEWFGFQIDSVKMQVDFEVSHENWGVLKTYHPKENNYVKIVKEYEREAA